MVGGQATGTTEWCRGGAVGVGANRYVREPVCAAHCRDQRVGRGEKGIGGAGAVVVAPKSPAEANTVIFAALAA